MTDRHYINVRVDATMKQQLEDLARAANMDLSSYIRQNYIDLVNRKVIAPEETLKIQNPMEAGYPPVQSLPPPQPNPYVPQIPTQQPQFYGYPPSQYPYYPPPQVHAPDAMDALVAQLNKIFVAKMLKDLVAGNTELEEFIKVYQGKNGGGKKEDDFSFNDMMKWQMYMQQQEHQYTREQQHYQQQIMMWEDKRRQAEQSGDKGKQNEALQMITALTTAQMQASQNFMQQFMAAMQLQQNTQTTLFNTALGTSRQSEQDRAVAQKDFFTAITNVQSQLADTKLQGIQNTATLQLTHLQAELERIRTEGKKDVITQLGELLELRDKNPVYKAAFNAAFGIKAEGGIGELLPKLKELGIDKVIDTVVSTAKALVTRPAVPAPQPTEIPPPMPAPTENELKELQQERLPGMENEPRPQEQRPQETSGPITVQPPEETQTQPEETIGYTNIEVIREGTEQTPPPPPPPPEETRRRKTPPPQP